MDMTIDETVDALVRRGAFWFGGPATIERIQHAERVLDTKFPAAFVVWLMRYGGGGARGSEISGVYAPEDDLEMGSVIADTLRLRESVGLPRGLIALLCHGEVPWCLRVDGESGAACPVVSFEDGSTTVIYPDFAAFFADYVVAAAQRIGGDLRKDPPAR